MNREQTAISDAFLEGLRKYRDYNSDKINIESAHAVITNYLQSPIDFTGDGDAIQEFKTVIDCLEELNVDKVLIILLKTVHASITVCRDSMNQSFAIAPLDSVKEEVERCLYYGRSIVKAFHSLIVESA